MPHRGEQRRGSSPNLVEWRTLAKFGVLFFNIAELDDEGVVLGVGDLRLVLLEIPLAVVADQLRELRRRGRRNRPLIRTDGGRAPRLRAACPRRRASRSDSRADDLVADVAGDDLARCRTTGGLFEAHPQLGDARPLGVTVRARLPRGPDFRRGAVGRSNYAGRAPPPRRAGPPGCRRGPSSSRRRSRRRIAKVHPQSRVPGAGRP